MSSYSPPFVLNGRQSNAEDPFRSPSKNGSKYRSHDQPTPKAHRDLNGSWRSRSSSNGSDLSQTKSKSNSAGPTDTNFGDTQRKLSFGLDDVSKTPNDSGKRLGQHAVVKAEDAQAVYPPSCCVFVAK